MTSREQVPATGREPVPPHAPGAGAPVLLLVAFALGLASWIATQHLARRLGAGPALGPWLYKAPPAAASWWRAGAVLFAGAALALALVLRARDGPSRRWWLAIGFVGAVGA